MKLDEKREIDENYKINHPSTKTDQIYNLLLFNTVNYWIYLQ